MLNYNLQPYDKDNLDTTGERTIPWFRENLMEIVATNLPAKRGTAIDIGCGNGRFIPILKEFGFQVIMGIDPVAKINKDYFSGDGVYYRRDRLEEYIHGTFCRYQVAFLFGSFHIMSKMYREGIFSLIKDVAKAAIFMLDNNDLEDFNYLNIRNCPTKLFTVGRTSIIHMEF